MKDFHIDLNEGFRSFNSKRFPMYKIYMNGREYEIREVEALFLSGKIQKVLENDENANLINIEIKKEEVFEGYDIGEAEFEKVLSKSFEQILDIVHDIFSYMSNLKEDNNREMTLEELCCTKVILDILESKSVKVKEWEYGEIERLGKKKVIEILNVIGSEKSIEYVGKHLMEIKEEEGKLIGKISPGRLEEVLRWEGVRVRGEGDILRVVEESIRVYGWGAGFLLGCVEASLLSWRDRNRYIELISQYISAINNRIEDIREYRRYERESDDNRRRRRERIENKWKGRVEIEGEIVESLLRCVGQNEGEGLKVNKAQSTDVKDQIIEIGERIGMSEFIAQSGVIEEYKAKNLNEYFKGRITMSAKTIYDSDNRYKPENVLIPGDGQYYHSGKDDMNNWIQFDFPEEICVRKLDIRPYGNVDNPRRLNIKTVNGVNEDKIGMAEFPWEDTRTYTFEITKYVWTKSIRIEIDEENYCDAFDWRYVLVLNEVVIYGHTFV